MEQKIEQKINYVMHRDDNKIMRYDVPDIAEKWETIPSGIYKTFNVGGPVMVAAYQITKPVENLIKFKTGAVAEVIDKTDKFFTEESINDYKRLQVAHKMGILMHGKPGVGKTSCAYLIMQLLAEKYNAICLDLTNKNVNWIKHIVNDIRKIQPNPLVVFIDEFDYLVKNDEEALLTFLDGSDSIDGVITLGCTNYIDKIPDRIKNRKSRMKMKLEINSFPLEVYKEFILTKVPDVTGNTLGMLSYIALEMGLPLDDLKHILIDHFIEKTPMKEIMKVYANIEIKEDKKEDNKLLTINLPTGNLDVGNPSDMINRIIVWGLDEPEDASDLK